MSRTLLATLDGIQSALPSAVEEITPTETVRLRDALLELLRDQNLLCATSTAKSSSAVPGVVRDPGWAKDLSQFVARMMPHDIFSLDVDTGLWVAERVAVKILTVRPEVDDDGVICAWMYEES